MAYLLSFPDYSLIIADVVASLHISEPHDKGVVMIAICSKKILIVITVYCPAPKMSFSHPPLALVWMFIFILENIDFAFARDAEILHSACWQMTCKTKIIAIS